MSDVSVSLGVTGKSEVLNSLNQVGSAASRISKLGAGIGSLLAPVAGFAASIATVAGAIAGMKGALDLGGELTDLSNRTGIGAGVLYDLGQAGRDAGIPLEDIAGSVNKLQKSLGDTANSNVLQKLGLDRESLASASPEIAFQKIGMAISALPNSTQRTVVAMQLFGKSGAKLLQLFNDPAFQKGIGSSQAGQLLQQNAALFDRLSDAIGKTGPKIGEFFVGFNSENAANIERMAGAMERIMETVDPVQRGADAGNIIATFTEAIAGGQIGEVIWLSLQVAVGKFVNAMLSGVLSVGRVFYDALSIPVRAEFWVGLGNTLMSFVNSFNATLMRGIAAALNALKSVPFIGEKAGSAADSISGLASSYELQSAKQGVAGADNAKSIFDALAAGAKQSFAWGQILDTSGLEAELQTLVDSVYAAKEKSNRSASDSATAKSSKNASYDPSAIGMAAKQSIVADSLAKVGGGGFAVGPGSNPILEENKRQTALLSSINAGILRGSAASGQQDAVFK